MARPPVLSGYRCYHCGSDRTSKAGIAKGKRRFKCRGCRKFFIDPDERVDRPKKEALTEPDSSPEVRKVNPKSRMGLNRKELPSASHLLLKLRAIAEKLGRAPTTAEITELGKSGQSYKLWDYYTVFGSFQEALRRARIKLRYEQKFDEAQKKLLLDELRELSRRLERPLIGMDVMEAVTESSRAAKRGLERRVSPVNHYQIAFGTIPQAIAAAGVGPKVKWSREELITVLRKLDAQLDRPVEARDIDELYQAGTGPSSRQYARMFGGLAKARKAAGVRTGYDKGKGRTSYWQKYTKQELIDQMKALGEKLGRKPTDRDINRASKSGECASSITFSRMFGSLPDAYRAAGFLEDASNQRRWTDKQIVLAIKKLKKELGRFPGFHDLEAASRAGKTPTPGTVVRRIGKLTELRERF